MQCKNCQTEIDDKALICFRCGTATVEPVHRPVESPPRRAGLLSPVLLGVVFLLVAAFFLTSATDGEPISPAVWIMLGVAGALLVYRLRFR